MTSVFRLKADDLLPAFDALLADPDGSPPDLTAATEVRILMRRRGSEDLKVNALATGDADGIATYEWAPGDTDTRGVYFVDFKVRWPGDPDDKPQTYPQRGYLVVVIT